MSLNGYYLEETLYARSLEACASGTAVAASWSPENPLPWRFHTHDHHH